LFACGKIYLHRRRFVNACAASFCAHSNNNIANDACTIGEGKSQFSPRKAIGSTRHCKIIANTSLHCSNGFYRRIRPIHSDVLDWSKAGISAGIKRSRCNRGFRYYHLQFCNFLILRFNKRCVNHHVVDLYPICGCRSGCHRTKSENHDDSQQKSSYFFHVFVSFVFNIYSRQLSGGEYPT